MGRRGIAKAQARTGLVDRLQPRAEKGGHGGGRGYGVNNAVIGGNALDGKAGPPECGGHQSNGPRRWSKTGVPFGVGEELAKLRRRMVSLLANQLFERRLFAQA